MGTWTTRALAASLLWVAAAAPACAQVWGGFDESRLNYEPGVLNGGFQHTVLAGMITASGGSLAAPTAELTPASLSGIDVFYTSLLMGEGGPLSPSEQSALEAWLAGGGTLIVTADTAWTFNHWGYTSFTSAVGIGYFLGSNINDPATVVGAHEITTGVGQVPFTTGIGLTFPATAQRLMDSSGGHPFCVVMDPTTGHAGPGRVVVIGDHNLFTNPYLGAGFNTRLAQNLIGWANGGCIPDLTTSALPGSVGYGVPSGVVDNEDFFYYLAQFAAGNLGACDLTTGATPGSVGYGVPNGVLNNDDFFYYLTVFAAGC